MEKSEEKVTNILQNELDFNPEEITIERACRSGKTFKDDGGRNWKRTIVVRFLNYKDKDIGYGTEIFLSTKISRTILWK